MISFAKQKKDVLKSRSEEGPANLYLWIVSTILLFQGFLAASGFLRTIVYLGERLETTVPRVYWWWAVPIQATSWLLIVPLIAAVIVVGRSNVWRSAVLHVAIVIVAVLVSGLLLHRFAHIQSDQLKHLVDTKLAFDSNQANDSENTEPLEEKFDIVAATAEYRKKDYSDVKFHNSYGFQYWFGETSSILSAYSMLIAAGYAMLYFRTTVYRTQQTERLQTALVQLQHESLCNRLTPHFLFNTLNTISSLTLTDGAAARTCISQLGDLLRESIEALPEWEIRLQKELDILNTYLSIQKTRFGSTLEYTIDVEPGLEAALVPAFLLQPLVENCFKHGFQERVRSAHVGVSIKRQGEFCRIEVSDNGKQLESAQFLDERYGLGLTRQRLDLQYGRDAQLLYEPNQPTGLKVIVLVPIHGQNGKMV